MAEKRMFSKKIIDSDAFLDMPLSTQALYFHLSMRGDDDGFVGNPQRIIRLIGANKNDYDLLVAKSFIIIFESGIVVIKHWLINNYIRSDRKKQTTYLEELKQLKIKENKSYTFVGLPNDNQATTEISIEENRLDKISIEENREEPACVREKDVIDVKPLNVYEERFEKFWKHYPRKVGKGKVVEWFKKNKPSEKLLKQMIDAIEKQSQSKQWIEEDGRFIPNPTTWLNQGRWEDSVEIKVYEDDPLARFEIVDDE